MLDNYIYSTLNFVCNLCNLLKQSAACIPAHNSFATAYFILIWIKAKMNKCKGGTASKMVENIVLLMLKSQLSTNVICNGNQCPQDSCFCSNMYGIQHGTLLWGISNMNKGHLVQVKHFSWLHCPFFFSSSSFFCICS